MALFPAVALAFAIHTPLPPDSGAALFQAWCKSCHGADGRGTPAASTRLEVPPADLQDCKASTAEPEERWIEIVSRGGAAFGLSLDMPAFGEAATPAQIRAVVRYARSLCGELGWPPGELNFPRAFLVEKAYPEDEIVVADQARGQEYIYERRLGRAGSGRARALVLPAGVGPVLAAGTRRGLARRRAAGGGARAAAPPADRLRVVGLRGRAAISWVVAARLAQLFRCALTAPSACASTNHSHLSVPREISVQMSDASTSSRSAVWSIARRTRSPKPDSAEDRAHTCSSPVEIVSGYSGSSDRSATTRAVPSAIPPS